MGGSHNDFSTVICFFVFLLIVAISCEDAQINSSQGRTIKEPMITMKIVDCNYTFVWISMLEQDPERGSLYSQEQTCVTDVSPKGMSVTSVSALEVYMQNFQKQFMLKSRRFFVRETLDKFNILVIGYPLSNIFKFTLKVYSVYEGGETPPSHILCYRKTCPTKPTQTAPSKPCPTDGPAVGQSASEKSPTPDLLLVYQIAAGVGAFVALILALLALITCLKHRQSRQYSNKLRQDLERANRVSRRISQENPLYGNINRRRSTLSQNKEKVLDSAQNTLLDRESFSTIHTQLPENGSHKSQGSRGADSC